MTTLQDLIAQKEALEAQISEQRQQELSAAIGQVKALVAVHKLTAENIFGSTTRRAKSADKPASKVAAKYLDPNTGATWSGRGLAPKWLAGKNKEDFLIAK